MGAGAIFSPLLMIAMAVMAYGDLTSMRIPNRLVIVIAGLVAASLVFVPFDEILTRLLFASIAAVVCLSMFAFGLLGGGDAKVLPVVMLAVPSHQMSLWLLLLAVSTPIVLMALSFAQRSNALREMGWLAVRTKTHFPQGVPIAIATVIVLALPFA